MRAADRSQAELQDFDEVLYLHWGRVHRFILASVRDAEAAHALTQDCFLRAYSRRHTFRGQASVKTWLMQIAVNLVRDYSRNRRLQFWKRLTASAANPADVSDHIPDAAPSPERRVLLKEQVQLVWQASQELPHRQRSVFLLRFVEDMDLLEIAAATGMKEGTVKVHLFRALQAIRKKLGDRNEFALVFGTDFQMGGGRPESG
jgi:RNA polymerase sigma-70 factor (ECF subfamily)